MAICWITNTITLYNTPAHSIALYLYTHNRFRKGDILTSISFQAVSQICGRLNSLMTAYTIQFIEWLSKLARIFASELSPFYHRAIVFCVTGDITF